MKYMFARKFTVRTFFTLLAVVLAFSAAANAQRSKAKATPAKKSEKVSKDAKKVSKKEADKKKKDTAKDKRDSKNSRDKASARKSDRKDDRKADRSKPSSKASAKADARRREEAERHRVEAERRAAALAEQHRREQAAREARARKLAFENSLRGQTIANIANDNTDGEDLNIRRAVINALGDHAGSIVVMEAQTGKVLTVVNQQWAVRDSIKPCSTIKLVTGVAGLNEDVIDKSDGSVRNAATRRKLDDAIAFSDNAYFQRVGANVGNAKMIDYARQLGLGQPTGINIEGETAGKLAIGNNNLRIYSHGDDFEVSTVQLAVLVSAITNGGHRVLPRVPRREFQNSAFQPFYRANIDLPQTNVRRMIPGMMGAAEYGTAHRGMDQGLGVAGKTGSCIGKGSWVGLFASVAPIEKPKYAVAVITRGQRERGRVAAGIAAQIYSSLARNIVRTDRNLAQTEFHIIPRDQRTVRAIPAADEDEDDTDAAMAAEPGNSVNDQNDKGRPGIIFVPATPKPVAPGPKLVQRTGDSKPLFPPVVINVPKRQYDDDMDEPAASQPKDNKSDRKKKRDRVYIQKDSK